MAANETLRDDILQRLSRVIDPETGVDVVQMQLILDLKVDEQGNVSYKFRPSSPLCPLAVPLVMSILEAVQEVIEGRFQQIEVVDYIQADELNRMLKGVLPKPKV